jgi:hypothetical protein
MLNPASSAVAAIRARAGPMLSGAPGQLNFAMCSPISMSYFFLMSAGARSSVQVGRP